jgi:hypothetical protein
MTDQERISLLEKKVKNLQYVNYVRFTLLALGFLGVTGYILNELKKKK